MIYSLFCSLIDRHFNTTVEPVIRELDNKAFLSFPCHCSSGTLSLFASNSTLKSSLDIALRAFMTYELTPDQLRKAKSAVSASFASINHTVYLEPQLISRWEHEERGLIADVGRKLVTAKINGQCRMNLEVHHSRNVSSGHRRSNDKIRLRSTIFGSGRLHHYRRKPHRVGE